MDAGNVLSIGTSASGLTLGLVAGFKMYFPSAPSWLVFTLSLVFGCLLSALFALQQNAVFDASGIATVVIGGLTAGLTAAGISRADRVADEKRTAAQLGAYQE